MQRLMDGRGSQVDLQILERLQESLMGGRCLCPLGDSAGVVIQSTMQHFRDEYEAHVRGECERCGQRQEVAASA
jgi:NADH-quinone oxidoreductase subunit F